MNRIIFSQIPYLSTDGLFILAQDCERRMWSQATGGYVNEEYIEGQRQIIFAIHEELVKRK